MTDFGPPIEVNGVRPKWLGDDERVALRGERGWRSGFAPDSRRTALNAALNGLWRYATSFCLPSDHWAYPVIEKGFEPWSGGDEAPSDWDRCGVMFHDGEVDDEGGPFFWGRLNGGLAIIGYRKKGKAMNATEWLAQGRKLQAEGKLPAGVTLPDPEIDYERYRAALLAFNEATGYTEYRDMGDDDKVYVRGLIAAMPFMPKD